MLGKVVSASGGPPRRTVIVGTAGDPRVAGFQSARARAGLEAAAVLDYRDLVADPGNAAARVEAPAIVRIDSPGRDPAVLAGLLALGIAGCEDRGFACLLRSRIEEQSAERGRLLPPRQLFFGLKAVLDALSRRAQCAGDATGIHGIQLTPDPRAILLAFDKTQCRELLASNQVPVPRALPEIASFDALMAAMQSAGMPRVFIKLRHGSAAAGTVALATSHLGVRAISTVEMVTSAAGVRLYNTRRLRTYSSPADIKRLVDALAPFGLHVEAWIPKISVDGQIADLRVLVMNSEPAFRLLRKSRHPITNLHLGGERADADLLLDRMPHQAVAALDATCRKVARLMPGTLQLAIDIAVAIGLKRHYVLEVNAFGDLLKGVTRDGFDPYDLQVQAMEHAA